MKKALSKLTFLFVFIMLIGVSVSLGATKADAATYEGYCGADGDNLIWAADTATGVLTISGTGEMADYHTSTPAPWYEYASSLKTVVIEDGVASIGRYAFNNCGNLTSITIPASVTSMGTGAFLYCRALTGVYITDIAAWCKITFLGMADDNPLYYAHNLYLNGSLVTELVIPEGVTTISGDAFSGCSSLTSVIISNTVTCIDDYTFFKCTGLTSATIPDSVRNIDEHAFAYCTGLTSVTIPASVTDIGNFAFKGCTDLCLCVYQNSAAHRYAVDNSIEYKLILFGECGADGDNLTWTLNTATGVLTISGKGKMADYAQNAASPWAGNIYLKTAIVESGVTSIGKYAFSGSLGLTNVIIPDTVTSIGLAAFRNCRGLPTINIPKSMTEIGTSAFAYWTGLTTIVIPESVKIIGEGAFNNCTALTEIIISNGVERINSSAFAGCTSLSIITIPNSITYIGYNAFYKCPNVCLCVYENSVAHRYAVDNSIEYKLILFGECGASGDNLTWALNTATGVLTISGTGEMADYHTSMPAPWYEYASSVKTVVIEDGVASIGRYAFNNCGNLTSITIPASVTSMGTGAFLYCRALTGVYITDIAAWCKISFFGMADDNPLFYAHNLYLNGSLVTELVIPEGVTTISGDAFSGCSSLTSVIISNTVTRIDDYAFFECTGLTSATIPDSVRNIDEHAFAYCTGLTSVTIPASVTDIGNFAFKGCTKLCIYVYKNSAAHKYASDNKISFEFIDTGVEGDINGDGILTNADITLMIRYLCGWDMTETLGDGFDALVFDVTYDGKINNRDAIWCIRKLAL